MQVKLSLFANLPEIVGTKEVLWEAEPPKSLKELLSDFCGKYGKECRELLFTPEGELQENIIFLVNGSPVNVRETVNLSDGDEIFILPPTAGG